jgi:hypothetical protein
MPSASPSFGETLHPHQHPGDSAVRITDQSSRLGSNESRNTVASAASI